MANERPVFEELSDAAGDRLSLTGFLGEILQPTDPTFQAIGGNWEAYRSLLRDDQVSFCFCLLYTSPSPRD